MVCGGGRCSCGAICRRVFCRTKPTNNECDLLEDGAPVTLNELVEAVELSFTHTLTAPIQVGTLVVCTGTPSVDFPWFAVNVGCGAPPAEGRRPDIAVHFNVRLPQCYVVRNSRRGGSWGPEETTAFRLFPFKVGRPFSIEVLIDRSTTLWAVDGEHYCSFEHRLPSPLAAKWVQITGIKDATINVQKTEVYPALAPQPCEIPRIPYFNAPAVDEPTWRPNAMVSIPEGIPEGYQIVIHGRLRSTLHSFTLDVLEAAREWPRPHVHLHVNVRAHVDATRDRQLVVLNAWFGSWGSERRQRTAKFIPGDMTTLRVVRGAREWSVHADALQVGELPQRAGAGGARALRLRGDLLPDRIYLCPVDAEPPPDQYASPPPASLHHVSISATSSPFTVIDAHAAVDASTC